MTFDSLDVPLSCAAAIHVHVPKCVQHLHVSAAGAAAEYVRNDGQRFGTIVYTICTPVRNGGAELTIHEHTKVRIRRGGIFRN